MDNADLSDLSAFVAVAQARGFRQAALLRGVSASSLSEAVRRVELQLGVRLLNRTTRSVTPTEPGQRLLERLTPAFGEIASALDDINSFRDSPTGTLRLNVPSIVGREILPGILPRFLAAHPGITVEVAANDTFIDVLAAGFDAGVRYDERIERDMIAVPLGPRIQRFATAAAPAYLARRGTPMHPRELLQHDCIGHKFDSGVLAVWTFERDDESIRITPNGPVVASMIQLETSVAVAGLGIIRSFEEFLQPLIEEGALVPILDGWQQTFSGPFLYYSSRKHVPAPLRAFIEFLRADEATWAE